MPVTKVLMIAFATRALVLEDAELNFFGHALRVLLIAADDHSPRSIVGRVVLGVLLGTAALLPATLELAWRSRSTWRQVIADPDGRRAVGALGIATGLYSTLGLPALCLAMLVGALLFGVVGVGSGCRTLRRRAYDSVTQMRLRAPPSAVGGSSPEPPSANELASAPDPQRSSPKPGGP